VEQTEMRQGIAKIISLAGVREAMGAGGMEVIRIDAWALKGLNLRLPPCEGDEGAFQPVTAE
jgi:hypothetical protein